METRVPRLRRANQYPWFRIFVNGIMMEALDAADASYCEARTWRRSNRKL